jgi:hypothetical protein
MRVFVTAATILAGLALAACGGDEPAAAGPAPDPDRAVSAPARRSTAPPSDPAACRDLSRQLPGRPLAEATDLAQTAGCAIRVVARDGRDLPVTEDYSETRINVRVRAGVIEDVTGLF